MCKWWLFFGIAAGAWGASEDWRQILDRVRENAIHQVEKSTNYTCMEVIDRTSFRNSRNLLPGCAYESGTPERVKITHDRLRLDIAVSEGKEIYAWHGQKKFAGSSAIDDVVHGGATSSGEFVGFLQNIFGKAGVRFEYMGEATVNGVPSYSFNYSVPLARSSYHVGSRRGRPVVAFHGSFAVRGPDLQLANLSIIADDIPENSNICSAETDMEYQIAKISGQDALIPSLFTLKLDDVDHFYSVSRSEYSECHAYGAESTLRFDTGDAAGSMSEQQAREEALPVGTVLHIALRSPITEETSFTGDPVQGVLLNAVNAKGVQIPKNSPVSGVITTLREFDEPVQFYLVSIEFERLAFGGRTFVFRARPEALNLEAKKLSGIYKSVWPSDIQEIYAGGVFVVRSPHVHLDQKFSAYWTTQAPSADGNR